MPKQKKSSRRVEQSAKEKLAHIRELCIKANSECATRQIHLADVIFTLQDIYQRELPDAAVSILSQAMWNLRKDDLALQEEEAFDYIDFLIRTKDETV